MSNYESDFQYDDEDDDMEKSMHVHVVSWVNTITGTNMEKVFYSLNSCNAFEAADRFLMEIVERGRACHGDPDRFEPHPSITHLVCPADSFHYPCGQNTELEPVYPTR